MAGVRQRKRDLVDGLIATHKARFAADGLEFILGEGRFIAPKIIEVQLTQGGVRHLEGERVFLNLGTHAAIPDTPGLSGVAPLTHVEALELDRLPTHLIVLGAGTEVAMFRLSRRLRVVFECLIGPIAMIGVALVIAVAEPRCYFSQVTFADWLAAQRTKKLWAGCPAVD